LTKIVPNRRPREICKIVDAQKEDRLGGEIREIHDAAQDCLTGGLYSQASGESGASFATGRQANGGDLLIIAKRHPGERLDKIWESLGKDFALTEGIATGEFTHREAQLRRASRTGHIPQGSLIMTMDRR
jgi:hypothetical protein